MLTPLTFPLGRLRVRIAMSAPEPQPLSAAISQLIALRGFARPQGNDDLGAAWRKAAGDEIAAHARPERLVRGTLNVAVDNAPLLSELTAFQGTEILARLTEAAPHLRVRKLKFHRAGLR